MPGDELRKLLERVGWTRRFLANYLGVNEETVAGWVRGDNAGPGYNAAVRLVGNLARYLGV